MPSSELSGDSLSVSTRRRLDIESAIISEGRSISKGQGRALESQEIISEVDGLEIRGKERVGRLLVL
jgi:hypothetical protein